MTEARLPTPRRIARTPVIRQPSGFSALGDALNVAGTAGAQFEARRQDTQERVEEIDHRIAMDEQRRQDDARYIEETQRWVQLEAETQAAVADLRQNAGPFARGHDEQVRKLLDQRFREFDESLVDNDRVRQRLRLNIAQSAARIDVTEQSWQLQQEFKAQGEALENTATTRRNQLSRVDPAKFEETLAAYVAEGHDMIAAGAFNADQAAVMERAYTTQLVLGGIDGLFNAGKPDAVQALIDNGRLDRFDLDVTKIADQVAGEKRALDILAQQQQAEALTKAREAADALEAKIALGINPSQAEFDAVNAQLTGAGAPADEQIKFGGLTIQMGLNRQFSEAADPEGIAAARTATALQGKIASGTASEAEQVAAAHLSTVADARAKAAGVKRRELAGQGVQGQMAVLADLDRMPPEQRFTAANAAMEGLGYVAQLPERTRQYALTGREVRKARPADFGDKAQVDEQFRAATGEVAAFLGGSYDEVMALAWDIYSGELASKGRAGWEPATFGTIVNVALGRTRRADGTTQGGLGDFNGKVLLPSFQNEDEFGRMVRSLTFSAAVYADGRPAVKGDVLDNYRPEYTRDSPDGQPIYRMIDASGRPLLKKGGGFYDFVAPRAAKPGAR